MDDTTPFDGVPPSTDVLVSGPPLSGKTDLALTCLAERANGSVVLTAHERATDIVDAFADVGGDGTLRVVDCSGLADGGGERVSVVSGPSDLTTAGVQLTVAVEDVRGTDAVDAEASTGVALCSLSHLLSYHETDRVCRFVDAVRSRLDAAGFVVGVLNDRMHDDETVAALTAQFDAVAETRLRDDGRQTRLRGGTGSSTEWRPF